MKTKADGIAWAVPVMESSFGDRLESGLHGMPIILYRGQHGWKTGSGALAFPSLPHQLYVKNLEPLFGEWGIREIVAVDLANGKWVTLWARSKSELSFAQPTLNKRLRAANTDTRSGLAALEAENKELRRHAIHSSSEGTNFYYDHLCEDQAAQIAMMREALELLRKVRLPESMPGLRGVIESAIATTPSSMVAVERGLLSDLRGVLESLTASDRTLRISVQVFLDRLAAAIGEEDHDG